MNYDEPLWRCPYCVHMQNMSQPPQPGNPNPPYMRQPQQPPYPQTAGPMTQPGMPMQPGMGMQPGNGQMNPPIMGPGPQIPPYMSPSGMPYRAGNADRMSEGNALGDSWLGTPGGQPVPYYQMYGYPAAYYDEQENEKDMQRMKEMYPDVARKILQHVEEECDKMEYDGSMMFDERPDRVMLLKITNDIYDKVKDEFDLPEEEDKDDVLAMNKETRRRYPPKKNWLGDMIEVLLFQEMHRRRCRHRNCRRWY